MISTDREIPAKLKSKLNQFNSKGEPLWIPNILKSFDSNSRSKPTSLSSFDFDKQDNRMIFSVRPWEIEKPPKTLFRKYRAIVAH